jgi:hypothetical protein
VKGCQLIAKLQDSGQWTCTENRGEGPRRERQTERERGQQNNEFKELTIDRILKTVSEGKGRRGEFETHL